MLLELNTTNLKTYLNNIYAGYLFLSIIGNIVLGLVLIKRVYIIIVLPHPYRNKIAPNSL